MISYFKKIVRLIRKSHFLDLKITKFILWVCLIRILMQAILIVLAITETELDWYSYQIIILFNFMTNLLLMITIIYVWLNLSSTRTLAKITHDLRTPLSRLKVRAETVKYSHPANLDDINELESMIDDILVYTKHDELTKELINKIDLYSLLDAIVDEYQDMGRQVSFTGKVSNTNINARRLTLKRAFTNVINNGLKFGDQVKITITNDHQWININFTDNGSGVHEEDLVQLMKPFYKAKNATHVTGLGLGLTIMNEIVIHHKGNVCLSNKSTGGLQVDIQLPLSNA